MFKQNIKHGLRMKNFVLNQSDITIIIKNMVPQAEIEIKKIKIRLRHCLLCYLVLSSVPLMNPA